MNTMKSVLMEDPIVLWARFSAPGELMGIKIPRQSVHNPCHVSTVFTGGDDVKQARGTIRSLRRTRRERNREKARNLPRNRPGNLAQTAVFCYTSNQILCVMVIVLI